MRGEAMRAIRALDLAELEKRALETRRELFTSRFALSTGQLADTAKVRRLRRVYAQMQTILQERRRAATKSKYGAIHE